MPQASPSQVLAHVELLRAIDRLLAEAESVRIKREKLSKLLTKPADDSEQEGIGHA